MSDRKYFLKKACSLDVGEVFEKLKTGEHGLESREAEKRLEEYGKNKLPEGKIEGTLEIFFHQFKSPLIFILLFATVILYFIDEKMDSVVIMVVLLFNAIIGTIQEGKAQNTFLALRRFVKTDASVFRDGAEMVIPAENLVPGDVIILREGEKIPADARVFQAESLKTEEAALTGESNPKFKSPETISCESGIADQKNIVFKGTCVVSGNGRAAVFATGEETVIGRISREAMGIESDLPLKNEIKSFSRAIIFAVAFLSLAVFLLTLWQGYALKDSFTILVAMAVSLIPEGLPIVVTLVLATGVWRMSKRNVLVKKLQAVDALGQTSVIAVDKTGTITKNELTVREVWTDGKIFKVEGSGYEPKGDIVLDGKTVEPLNHPELLLAGKIGSLCSGASVAFSEENSSWKVMGDPTEAATLVFGQKVGFHKEDLEKELPRIDEAPFDYELKYHATLHRDEKNDFLSVIGAPEEVLGLCEKVWKSGREENFTEEEKKALKKVFLQMSSRGLRVVGFALKKSGKISEIPKKVSNLTFLGFFGIQDIPRSEVRESVERVNSAGIKLVMITGDHSETARAVASEVGIFREGDLILEGKELEALSEEELTFRIEKTSVFSRVSPMHKLKIINAYKSRGETIAMTGDGINDALSLTSADVGVSMGKIGTEVAKESSDIVLLDDNFGSIVSGVEEGRNIYKTIRRVVLYLFSTGIGEILAILGAIFLGLPVPILAVQILWLNLVTDGFLDVSLAMEPKEEGLLDKKFKKTDSRLLDKFMAERALLMGLTMAVGTLILFNDYYEEDLSKAWTVSLTLLAVFQWFNAWNCRSETKSIFSMNPFSNKFLIGATLLVAGLQFLAVYNPLFQKFLRTAPLDMEDWLLIFIFASSIIFVEETRKLIRRLINKKTAQKNV